MTSSIIEVVTHYQKSIERCQNDEERLLHCIHKLYKLPIKVEHLQETGIGKTVNSLRKFNGEIGVAAKALVTKWKAMVAAEEEPSTTSYENTDNDDNRKNSNDRNTSDDDYTDTDHNNVSESRADVSSKHSHSHSKDKEKSKNKDTEKKHHSHNESSSSSKLSQQKEFSSKSKSSTSNTKHNYEIKEKQKEKERDSKSDNKSDKKSSSSSNSLKRKDDENKLDQGSHHQSKYAKKDLEEKETKKHLEKEKSKSHSKSKSSSRDKDKEHSKKSNNSSDSKSSSSIDRKRRQTSDDLKEPKNKNPKFKDNNDGDGIDSTTGANFGDVLGMLNMPSKKFKKTQNALKSPVSPSKSSNNIKEPSSKSQKTSKTESNSSTSTSAFKSNSNVKPDLLSSTTKLEPLDPSIALELPSISTNYKPMPLNQTVMDCVFNSSSSSKSNSRNFSDVDALSHGISSKTIRTKIYSGVRTGQMLQVPSLFDLCIRVLQKNIDALEYTGGVPFEVLRPVIERATPQQLLLFEEYNPYLMEDSDILWQAHVQRNYRTQKRLEMESWREMYLRCQEDQERKLNILAENIKQSQKIIAAPVRKTQLAFVDSMVKPPRNVQRKQEQFGTQAKLVATPAARVASLQSVTPNAAKTGDARLRVATSTRDTAQVTSVRPKKAPLMAKTIQFMTRIKR